VYRDPVYSTVTTTSGPSVSVHGWIAFVIITASVLGAVAVIWRIFWPLTKKVVHVTETWPSVEDVARLAPLVERINDQFQNNGGSSMRDAIDQNTALTAETRDMLHDISKQVSSIEARVAKLEQKREDPPQP
jgi:predicted PurR-regulated permease PerM